MINPIIIDNENQVEILTSINLSKDIVLSVPENTDILDFKLNGKISIKPKDQINISMINSLFNSTRHRTFKQKINLKIFTPNGVIPQFLPPENNSYLNISPYYQISYGFLNGKKIELKDKLIDFYSTYPNYLVYTDLELKISCDLDRIKEDNPQFILDNTKPLSDLIFTYVYSSVNYGIDRVFYIKNDQVFYNMLMDI